MYQELQERIICIYIYIYIYRERERERERERVYHIFWERIKYIK